MQARSAPGVRAALRGLVWLSLPLLVACGPSKVQSQKLKDGSWSFTCELAMDECIRRVQDRCPAQRYRILEGTAETRLRDAPPFQRAYHTSRLHLVCNDAGADVLLSIDSSSERDGSASAAAAKSSKACTAGQTRECVGPAACKGGQACLADGSGYGACDCGPAPQDAAAAAPPPTPVPPSPTAPDSTSDPATPAPAPAP
jgi:hypothetical protein